ncbi:hypothetical protein Tco_0598300 [Tanacetum coccineum]
MSAPFVSSSPSDVRGGKNLHSFPRISDLLDTGCIPMEELPVHSDDLFAWIYYSVPYFRLLAIDMYPNAACFGYDFMPLNSRILPSRSRFQTISKFGCVSTKFKILQSCSGLLLCSSSHDKLYHVYNPSIHLFTTLPQPHIRHLMFDTTYGGIKLAFDPTKSPHYKVIHAGRIYGDDDEVHIQIQTYFSGSRDWIICGGLYPYEDFECFDNEIYWNGAIHWLKDVNRVPLYSKLDIVDHPVLTTMFLKLPLTFNGVLHCNVKLFDSCGCLLLLYWDYTQPRQLKYNNEMQKVVHI